MRKEREKKNFSFGVLAPQKHFQANYTKIWLTLWKGTPHDQIWASLNKNNLKN